MTKSPTEDRKNTDAARMSYPEAWQRHHGTAWRLPCGHIAGEVVQMHTENRSWPLLLVYARSLLAEPKSPPRLQALVMGDAEIRCTICGRTCKWTAGHTDAGVIRSIVVEMARTPGQIQARDEKSDGKLRVRLRADGKRRDWRPKD